MKKIIFLVYAILAYFLFFTSFFYFILFVGNFPGAKNMDSPPIENSSILFDIFVDISLLVLFGLQHSGMARQSFKDLWGKIIPAPIERSTYVLFASLFIILLCWQWRPIPQHRPNLYGSVRR